MDKIVQNTLFIVNNLLINCDYVDNHVDNFLNPQKSSEIKSELQSAIIASLNLCSFHVRQCTGFYFSMLTQFSNGTLTFIVVPLPTSLSIMTSPR